MSTTLRSPQLWAQHEFAFAPLGDQRRTKRLVNIAFHLAASPGGTLPQAFPAWAELKAAYRFFGQRGVSFERILAPHLEHTRQACRAPGEYLLIEDGKKLQWTSTPIEGFGEAGVTCGTLEFREVPGGTVMPNCASIEFMLCAVKGVCVVWSPVPSKPTTKPYPTN